MFQHIDRIREQAADALRQIAKWSGRDSAVYARSQEMWHDKERSASLWLVRGDFGRAGSVIREGLETLVRTRQSLGTRNRPFARLWFHLFQREACARPGERLA